MRLHWISTLAIFAISSSLGLAQSTAHENQPTVAGARTFLDGANAELLKLNTNASRAQWIAETDITDDTEATAALVNGQVTGRILELVQESHRWDKVELPAELRRMMKLLQLNATAAPREPELLTEQTQLAAQLTGMYGKGKYCPDVPAGQATGPDAKCMGIDAISNIMAHSTDPEELTRLWVGWHAVGAPMRSKYERFIELQNTGAKEWVFTTRASSGARDTT